MENHSSMTVWQSCFSLTNPSNLWQLLQSLLLRYTAENEDTLCMLFQLC